MVRDGSEHAQATFKNANLVRGIGSAEHIEERDCADKTAIRADDVLAEGGDQGRPVLKVRRLCVVGLRLDGAAHKVEGSP